MRSFAIFVLLFSLSAFGQKSIGRVKKLSPKGLSYFPAFSNSPQKLKVGQKLYDRDRFTSDEEGRILIEALEVNAEGRKNLISLGPLSDLSLQSALDGGAGLTLNLNKGSVYCEVYKKYSGSGENEFRVQTPLAVVGVRGTKFHVSTGSNSTQVSVIEARLGSGVELRKSLLGTGDTKLLLAGESTVIGPQDIISDLKLSALDSLGKDLKSDILEDMKYLGAKIPQALFARQKNINHERHNAQIPENERYSGMKHSGSFFRDIRGQIRSETGVSRAEAAINAKELEDKESSNTSNSETISRKKKKETRFLSVERVLKEKSDQERTERLKKRGQNHLGLDRYKVVEGEAGEIKSDREKIENAPDEPVQARVVPEVEESTKDLINTQNEERANIRKARDELKNPPLN